MHAATAKHPPCPGGQVDDFFIVGGSGHYKCSVFSVQCSVFSVQAILAYVMVTRMRKRGTCGNGVLLERSLAYAFGLPLSLAYAFGLPLSLADAFELHA